MKPRTLAFDFMALTVQARFLSAVSSKSSALTVPSPVKCVTAVCRCGVRIIQGQELIALTRTRVDGFTIFSKRQSGGTTTIRNFCAICAFQPEDVNLGNMSRGRHLDGGFRFARLGRVSGR